MNSKWFYKKGIPLFTAAAMVFSSPVGSFLSRNAIAGETFAASLFPNSVTAMEPTSLRNISLPDSPYGRLSWVNPDYVAESYSQECRVKLVGNGTQDLTTVPGYDKEEGAVIANVTVYVLSLEPQVLEQTEDLIWEDADADLDGSQENQENTDIETLDGAVGSDEPSAFDGTVVLDQTGIEYNFAELEDLPMGEDSSGSLADSELDEADMDIDEEEPAAQIQISEESLMDIEGVNLENEKNEAALQEANAAMPQEEQSSQKDIEEVLEETTSEETPDKETPNKETPSEGDLLLIGDPAEGLSPNIFDDAEAIFELATVGASAELPETIGEEIEDDDYLGAALHTVGGITVAGSNLPWYVELQVSKSETVFDCQEGADIFQSFELSLYDTIAGTFYEVPDGEYVTVSLPVKTGYTYVVEHHLASGAVERIIPTLDGSTLLFSTHSFSPFGIAGNNSIIGDDDPVVDPVVDTPTPTPKAATATPTAKPVVTEFEPDEGEVVLITETPQSSSPSDTTRNTGEGTQNEGTVNTAAVGATNAYTGNVGAVATGDASPIQSYTTRLLLSLAAALLALGIRNKRR